MREAKKRSRSEEKRRERRAKRLAWKQKKQFEESHSASYLKALFQRFPEEVVLKGLPPVRRWQSRVGRKPFPRRAQLRALLARQAYGIRSFAALALRLSQDLSLKYECGFDMGRPAPSSDVLEDFAQLLGAHTSTLDAAHAQVVRRLAERLPDLGQDTSLDSTHVPILAPSGKAAPVEPAKNEPSASTPPTPTVATEPAAAAPAGGEAKTLRPRKSRKPITQAKPDKPALQADWGVKTYESSKEKKIRLANGITLDGIELTKIEMQLHGGKMHAIIDNRHRIPLKIKVTPQSQGDCPMIVPMYRELVATHRWMDIHSAMVDKAGDSEEVHRVLVNELGITPFIPLREIPNRQAPANPGHEFAKTVYDRDRDTHLIDPRTGRYEECERWGYDETRQALKYRCPCQRMRKEGRVGPHELCPFLGAQCGGSRGEAPYSFWVPLKNNWRYYCPVPRESKRWQERYKERTTIERLYNLIKCPLELGEKRLRSLTTAAAEAYLAGLLLCVRAEVALDWGAPEKVGTAVSEIPYRRHRLTV